MYIYIVTLTPKVYVSTIFTTFIYFCDISKIKNERKWFFLRKILVLLGYACKSIPKIRIPKKYWYGYDFIFRLLVLHRCLMVEFCQKKPSFNWWRMLWGVVMKVVISHLLFLIFCLYWRGGKRFKKYCFRN